jgi:hypothetical protein
MVRRRCLFMPPLINCCPKRSPFRCRDGHPRRCIPLKAIKAIREQLRRDVMQKRREPQPPIPARCLTYAFQTDTISGSRHGWKIVTAFYRRGRRKEIHLVIRDQELFVSNLPVPNYTQRSFAIVASCLTNKLARSRSISFEMRASRLIRRSVCQRVDAVPSFVPTLCAPRLLSVARHSRSVPPRAFDNTQQFTMVNNHCTQR